MTTRYGVPGSSPITPAGRVVYNARRAVNEIQERIRQLTLGRSSIKGGHNEDIWKMQRGNPVMSSRTNRFGEISQIETMTEVYVLDAANGIGRAGQRLWELNAERDAEGFIAINADYKEKAGDDIQGNHAPVSVGGLANVPNYGPKEIRKGQYVMISCPDPRNPKPVALTNAPRDKIPFWTLPYDPQDQTINKQAAYEIMTKMRDTRTSITLANSSSNAQNLIDFSQRLRSAIRVISMLGVISALEAGAVVPNPAGADQWRDAGEQWMDEDRKEEREDFYENLARAFGVVENRTMPSRSFRVTKHGKPGRNNEEMAMVDLLEELVFAKLPEYRVFAHKLAGGRRVVLGEKGEVNQQQSDLVVRLLASLATANYEITRLIVGQAKTTAKPGQYFDIILGGLMTNP